MTAKELLTELKPLGQENYKKVLFNHGVKEPCYGVKIEELKKFQKRIKKDYQLALDLFETGIYDAMYLAGLIADSERMTKKDLDHWAAKAYGPLSGSTVPTVTARSAHAWALAEAWIDSKEEMVAVAGWTTLSSLVSIQDDEELDQAKLKRLLQRVEKNIHKAANAVRYAMNGFVIALGGYVKDLTELAIETGERIGEVNVDMGNNACKVPFAPDYIRKMAKRGVIGKKRRQ